MGVIAEACVVSNNSSLGVYSDPAILAAFNQAHANLRMGIGVDDNLSDGQLGLSENIAFLRSLAGIRYGVIDADHVSKMLVELERHPCQVFDGKSFEYQNVLAFLRVCVRFGLGMRFL